LLKPQQGTVRAFGRERCTEDDFHEVRRRAGLLFQDADDQLFCPTVLDDVAFGPLNLGLDADAARHRARDALETVGLPDGFGRRITYRLSGGEKRLVALAGVLAMEPDALLLDEPTAGLDPQSRGDLLGQLHRLLGAGMTLVLSSHQMEDIAALTQRMTVMQRGTDAATGTVTEIFAQGEALNAWGLEQPTVTRIAEGLRQRGWSLPPGIVDHGVFVRQVRERLCP
jgi:energy-coupling factor transporter ATP-binding protein EcfA2